MADWTVPRDGSYHYLAGHEPHWFEGCGDWCAGQGWKGWAAKGTIVDIDEDPSDDPARFGASQQ